LRVDLGEDDKITGFSLGADDYITKPFSPRELTARVRAVLRRSGYGVDPESILSIAGLSIDIAAKKISTAQGELSLSPKEYDLLLLFVRHPNRVFSREDLLLNVWGYDFDGDERTVDATIKRLRQKAPATQDLIRTVWGSGYRLELNQP